VRYSLTLPVGGACADPEFLVDLAVRAEEAGWDGVFLEDYVLFHGKPTSATCDPWIALAAIAVRTSRLVLGTRVTPLARRRPWIVARQAAAIDQLSGGRMVFGAGLGDVGDHVIRDASFANFGEQPDPAVRAEMLDEGLDIIAGLWGGKPFAFSGSHYILDQVTFAPTPVQRPRIPIWIGGGYPHPGPTRRAARWDGSMLYRADGGQLQVSDVGSIRAAAGDRRYEISVGMERDATRREEVKRLAALESAGATWATEYIRASSRATMIEAVARGPVPI
jgi:alkanesulfonate monooxygenase SsuD/methylene tetrahydromethanopterin reductase-like flavin-dependent oxidoreductase (luciferase family)